MMRMARWRIREWWNPTAKATFNSRRSDGVPNYCPLIQCPDCNQMQDGRVVTSVKGKQPQMEASQRI